MLAIIIPYFKISNFEKTLQSLADQTDKRFHVYIGDDASPEPCEELLEKYIGQFDFKYHRFETNLGGSSLSKQWDRCIALSGNEEWLMILGDDDWLGYNVIEQFYAKIQEIENKYDVVRIATQIFYSDNKSFSKPFQHPNEEFYMDTYIKKLKGVSRSSLSEYIFKRKVYERYGFKNYPLAWNSDDRAWFDFSISKPIITINNALVFISVSSESISGMDTNLAIKNFSQIQFYQFLLWHYKLNFVQRVTIADLLLKHKGENVSFLNLIFAKTLIRIYYFLNKIK